MEGTEAKLNTLKKKIRGENETQEALMSTAKYGSESHASSWRSEHKDGVQNWSIYWMDPVRAKG